MNVLSRRISHGRWMLVLFAGLVLGTTLGLSGCGGNNSENKPTFKRKDKDKPIEVLCTTGMVADLVKKVGGEHVNVQQLMGEGVDPHTYNPSRGDVSTIYKADMVFYSGLHLESNLLSNFDSVGESKPVHAVGNELERWHHDRLIHDKGELHDPHVWFDVSLWKHGVRLVADRLADYDPKNARTYSKNAIAYIKELEALHTYAKKQIASIPESHRVLVTAHDAFSYFGKAYEIKVKAIQGKSTVGEAGLKSIGELTSFMVKHKIKAIFVESSVAKESVQQIIDGCKEEGHTVKLGGELFSDAMGQKGTKEGTYVGMIRHNVDSIVKALK